MSKRTRDEALEISNDRIATDQVQREMSTCTEDSTMMDISTVGNKNSSSIRNSIATVLSRSTPFGNETGPLPCGEFEPLSTIKSSSTLTSLSYLQITDESILSKRVLVIGAGGLGCEILKDLAMSHIVRNVDVIDLDTIDVTNLNRQFLFRQNDVGSSKAITAANFINTRCKWMNVIPHYCKIQDKSPSFYKQFSCIISGLDNIEARRWLNSTIIGLVQMENSTDNDTDDEPMIDLTTIIPIIDGGTEGFSGQARIILPKITSCFECTIDSFPPVTTFPLCTIAETPRRSEHCIAYAYILEWPKHYPDTKLDTDSPDHMMWIYERALDRATKYNIAGVTYMHTLGVVKNIIPAVASTNAIIAAACVNEAIKYLTFYSQSINTYMMYNGSDGIYSLTYVAEKKDDCIVCSNTVQTITLPCKGETTLLQLIQQLKDQYTLTSPSVVSSNGHTLYMPKPPMLEEATRPNLSKVVSSLIDTTIEELTITDPLLESMNLTISIQYDDAS